MRKRGALDVVVSCAIAFAVSLAAFTPTAHANLRDRIKERLLEKQNAKPAPALDTSPAKIERAGDFTFSLTSSGVERFYKVHVPKSYSASRPAPLLLVLHGGGGDMSIQATEEFYHQISKSESEGFIAVFPNGVSAFKSGKLATWNAGRCCGRARDTKSDDVSFLRDVIKKTRSQLSIDPRRIFATGMSNGAMMAYRLACEMPDTIRAIAAVAGTDNTETCHPAQPVSILHIHARNDDHVLFEGGAGKNAFRDSSKVTNFASVPSTIEKWRGLDGCDATAKPERVLEKKGATCDLYKSCKGGSRVQLCVIDDGGHSWPGGKKPSRLEGGTPSTAISANDVMWTFFHSL